MATRGSRTPGERAHDAARTAATMFEDLPPSRQKELYLEPIAVLLRFYFGSASAVRAEAAQAAYRGLLERLRSSWDAELVAGREGTDSELLADLKATLQEACRRAVGYADAARESPAAADDGLAFVAKAGELLDSARYGRADSITAANRELERAAVEHV